MAQKKDTKVTEQPQTETKPEVKGKSESKKSETKTKSDSTKAEAKVKAETKSKSESTKAEAKTKSDSTKAESKTKSASKKSESTKAEAKTKSTSKKTEVESTTEGEENKQRRKATKETIDYDFLTIEQRIEEEITKLEERKKTEKGKITGIQFLKQLRKLNKNLHRDASKVLKIKKTNRVSSETSGFKKPVKISDELCKFFGWDNTKLYSRTDVTREICKYITDNNLQDTVNKRIINPNAALVKLLDYKEKDMPVDAKTGKPALYYYCLQKLLTRHFPKPAAKDVKK
jgi:chromatin remodeling complex protein RSC6